MAVGIEETKDLVVLCASFSEGLYESLKDGRLSLGDYKHFLPMIGDILPALSGIEKVPEELKDLTQEEIDELVEYFKTEFDIPDDLVETFVENCIQTAKLVFHNIKLIKAWRDRE